MFCQLCHLKDLEPCDSVVEEEISAFTGSEESCLDYKGCMRASNRTVRTMVLERDELD